MTDCSKLLARLCLVGLCSLLPAVGLAAQKASPAAALKTLGKKRLVKKAAAKKASGKKGSAKKASAKQVRGKKALAPEQRLDRLLRELRGLPAEAWTKRRMRLTRQLGEQRAQVARLRGAAERAARRAASLQLQLKKLDEMRSLLRAAPRSSLSAAKSTAARKTSKRSAPKKSPAKETPAKKTRSKKPAAKKPVAKKLVAQKPGAKKPASATPRPKQPRAKGKSRASKLIAYDFETHVLPILEENCQVCHEPGETRGGLDLSTLASTLEGGSSGQVLVPGKPAQSRLYRLVTHQEKPFMPEDEDALPKAELEVLRRWIELGAPATAGAAKAAVLRLEKLRSKLARSKTKGGKALHAVFPTNWPRIPPAKLTGPAPIRALAASPGAALLAVSIDRQVHMLSSKDFRLLGILAPGVGRVEALRFSPDGRRLLVAGGIPGKRGSAAIYDVRSGKRLLKAGHNRDSFFCADLRNDGSCALAGASRLVRVHGPDGKQRFRIEQRDWVLALRFSPDGRRLACSDRKGQLLVTEVASARSLAKMDLRGGAAQALAWSPDGKQVLSLGKDGTLRRFDVARGREIGSTRFHKAAGLGLARSPQGTLASLALDGSLLAADQSARPRARRSTKLARAASLCISADGSYAYVGSLDGELLEIELGGKGRRRLVTPSRPRL